MVGTSGRQGLAWGLTMALLGAWTLVGEAQPAKKRGGKPAEAVAPEAGDADLVSIKLAEALAPQPGGLKAQDLANRVETISPEIQARQQAVAAAAARVNQAAWLFLPQFNMSARYMRLSPIDQPTLNDGGSLVGTDVGPGDPIPIVCPGGPGSSPDQCFASAAGVTVAFPVLLDSWTLQGTVQIPLSDYLLRFTHHHSAASRSRKAAEFATEAARVKARLDAKIAYYNWVRAKGNLVVAEQGLATTNLHLTDVKFAEEVGSASQADVLAVEGQVAANELLVENARSLAELTEEQIRVMMRDKEGTRYTIGEDIDAPVASEPAGSLAKLYQEALGQRLERRVLDETHASLRAARRATSAGYSPRLDAFGNVYHQNPSARVFPQQDKWLTTWDVGVQLSWTLNETFTTAPRVSEANAQIAEVEAQRAILDDGIRLQVTQAYNALRTALVAKATTERQLASAEESHRVRREAFRAGRAKSTELTDAETALLQARFDRLNARIDVRVARDRLDHVLGRDVGATKSPN